jgi:hypothetical protein
MFLGAGDSSGTPATTVPTTTPAQTVVHTTVPVTTPAAPAPTTAIPAKTPTTTPTPTPNATANASAATVTANLTTNATPVATLAITASSRPLSIGESAYDGTGNLTVNGISTRDKMSDPTPSYAIGKKYLIINITYENLDRNATTEAPAAQMKVMDIGGFTFDQVSDVLLENPYNGQAIAPKEQRTGNLLVIVPPEATFLTLQYTFGTRNVSFQLT